MTTRPDWPPPLPEIPAPPEVPSPIDGGAPAAQLADDTRAHLTAAAAALARSGAAVELRPAVGHRARQRGIALGAALSAVAAAVGWGRPAVGALAAGLLLGWALSPLRAAGAGPRSLLLRAPLRSLLWWPWASRSADHVLLLALPDRIPSRRPPSIALGLGAPAAAVLFSLSPEPWRDALAQPLIGGMVCFAALVGLATRLPARPRADALPLARSLGESAPALPLPRLRVGIAVVGGLYPWPEPLEILLQNGLPRLHPGHTLVAVWRPGPGPLRMEGDGGLAQIWREAAEAAGIPLDPAASALAPPPPSLRARRLGWRAVELRGGDDPRSGALAQLQRLFVHLDARAQAGAW